MKTLLCLSLLALAGCQQPITPGSERLAYGQYVSNDGGIARVLSITHNQGNLVTRYVGGEWQKFSVPECYGDALPNHLIYVSCDDVRAEGIYTDYPAK